MDAVPVAKPQVTVPFVCPICAAPNGVHLISLSRAGGVDCTGCGRWLKAADVMRAIHSPRGPAAEGQPRSVAVRDRARVATKGGTPTAPVSRRDSIVWPPTAETRASATPLKIRTKGT